MELKTISNLPVLGADKNAKLQLSPITLKEDYAKEWNVDCNDFVCLTKNGELINDSLFRVGGMNSSLDLEKDNYFMLLKYVEAFYKKEITDITKSDPKHLESRWCIFDRNGVLKAEFKTYAPVYLTKDSCIYSLDKKYYNIETGECYGYSSHSFESKDFLFFDNQFDKDASKCGVMKVNKKDGSFELFK